MDKIASPVHWVGGKSRLLEWLLPLLDVPCDLYCEPFGGSASVLLNRRPARIEVYNDADGNLANLLLCIREHPAELRRLLAELPYCREHHAAEIAWLRAGMPGRLTDLQRASRWWWLNLTGFGGQIDAGFGTAKTESIPTRSLNRLEKLERASRRLQTVVIENLDFREILDRYDRPESLFYCDPPYIGTEGMYEAAEGGGFGEREHRDLATLLGSLQGRAAVSYFEHPLLDELYPAANWRRSTKRRKVSLSNVKAADGGSLPEQTEVLLMNYDPPAQGKLGF